ncbi:MAG: M23 family metallopeptidase [Polyangiaceae bacterium]|nr:M23 family metallopeptidase [Polyangiaceae bacterium]
MRRTIHRCVLASLPAVVLACASGAASGGAPVVPTAPAETPAPRTPRGGPALGAGGAPGLVAAPGPAAALAKLGSPWGYVLPVDHGIRADTLGKGFFRAPRSHGEHNGLDLLAPVGTAVVAPCAGQAQAGKTGGFGQWVHVVCALPATLGAGLYASLFYAHLGTLAVGRRLAPVQAGERLGTVGKTGNAAAPQIAAHVHFELIVQPSEAAALAETHSGRDQSNNPGADRFFELLGEHCLAPSGFHPRAGAIRRERRADPFLALSCLTLAKPPLTRPAGALAEAFVPWSDAYGASAFDVNLGRGHPLASALAQPAPPKAWRPPALDG